MVCSQPECLPVQFNVVVEHRCLTYMDTYIHLHFTYTIHCPYLILTNFPSSLEQLNESLILFPRRIQYRLHLTEFIFTFVSSLINILSIIFTSFAQFKHHLSFILNFPKAALSRPFSFPHVLHRTNAPPLPTLSPGHSP